jgi:hypothetical protein
MKELNKTVQNNPYAECDRIQELTEELVDLKTILSKQFLKGEVAKIVENCCSGSIVSGDKTLLNSYLEWGRKWARFREKLVILVQGLPKNDISTMLVQAFTRAVNTPNQISDSPSVFFDDDRVDSYYPYGPQEFKPQAVDTDLSNAEHPGYTGNRDYPLDPSVFYLEPKEKFYKDYEAWRRRNPSSIADLF